MQVEYGNESTEIRLYKCPSNEMSGYCIKYANSSDIRTSVLLFYAAFYDASYSAIWQYLLIFMFAAYVFLC